MNFKDILNTRRFKLSSTNKFDPKITRSINDLGLPLPKDMEVSIPYSNLYHGTHSGLYDSINNNGLLVNKIKDSFFVGLRTNEPRIYCSPDINLASIEAEDTVEEYRHHSKSKKNVKQLIVYINASLCPNKWYVDQECWEQDYDSEGNLVNVQAFYSKENIPRSCITYLEIL